ncbi:MAG: folate-binding protein YgfZ [Acidimicrobiales bacterium]|nr:folate-binding protein YgfZ [Acidimicrobiales bacterium]
MTAASDPAVSDVVDLRTTPGAVEIDRDALRVAGPDAVDYLQGQLSQDVAALAVGATAWSFVLQPAGKVDAWLRVTRTGDDALVLDVDGGHGEAVVARLRRFLLRTKADVDALAWRCIAVRGPGAGEATSGAAAEVAAPAGWPGVEGVDLLGPQVQAPDGVAVVGRPAYDSLRVRCGVPLMGAELSEATIPAEMGQWVIDQAVSFTKGCFTGQELVARIDSRGGNVPRRLRGLVVTGDRAPAVGAAVVVDGAEVGQVASVAPRPGGGSVALAIVRRGVSPPAVAQVGVAGGELAATVVDLPIES